MSSLAIDVGNTFIKAGVFEQDKLIYTERYKTTSAPPTADILTRYGVTKAIISTVIANNDWISALATSVPLTRFTNGMNKRIINHYLTPETLGPDRLAAVIGANYLYPGKNNLVINGGTCITYDWIDRKGNYFGGSISPGLSMRYKALNYYTAALPLVAADDSFAADEGNDTVEAIWSGVQNGIKYELTGFIESYRKKGQDVNIILTGGDGIFFDTLLKNSIFAPCIKNEPYLVLKGLNAALNTNND